MASRSEGGQYVIAEFPEENNSVAIIHSKWLIGNSHCMWPPEMRHVDSLLRVQAALGPDWHRESCIVLRKFDTYAEARLRLPKASGSSGLSSHESDYGKGKRKKKATRKLSSADEEIPSPPASMIKRAKYITQPQRPTKEPLRDLPPPTHTEDDWAYDIAWETPPLPQRAVSQFDHCQESKVRHFSSPAPHLQNTRCTDSPISRPSRDCGLNFAQRTQSANGPDPTSRGTTTPGSHSAPRSKKVELLSSHPVGSKRPPASSVIWNWWVYHWRGHKTDSTAVADPSTGCTVQLGRAKGQKKVYGP
ncbi:uncharacterized protein LOC119446672 [Dermacentor silvarum]|uniref:uncharacterized protein LOC119446672 n=1 Tax=Dermacentor silvarum TaxID=543639 RepID=UPI002100A2B6|nr:uncharacterized protein LOC119446672 [Dermacentor silvarum]